jgi:hypothetical protein
VSNSSPPDPPSLKPDEWIAIIVAFTTIGSILYGALNKKNDGFSFKNLWSSPPSPQPNSTPEALPTPKPTTTAPELSSPEAKTSLIPRLSKPQAPQESTSPDSPPDIAPSTPIPTAPTPAPVVEFSDVPNNSWASRFIKFLNKRNISVGFPDGSFQPNKLATRAEFAALLTKVFDQGNRRSAIDFKDLPANYWATNAIKEVSKTEVLTGYPGEVFRPNQPVTRVEVLVALAKALNLETPSTPAKTLEIYKDGDQVPDYAIAQVAAATEAGLVTGYANEKLLIPNKPATRAEVAAMIYQALVIKILAAENPVSTPLGDGNPSSRFANVNSDKNLNSFLVTTSDSPSNSKLC